jgi:uncharacterized protein
MPSPNNFIKICKILSINVKIFSLFSFLFGIGFYIQLKRFESKNIPFKFFYFRRLLILFLIGLFHGIIIWPGDILTLYAVTGLLLLFFKKISNKWLLFISIIFLLITPLFILMGAFGIKMAKIFDPESIKRMEEILNMYKKEARRAYTVYSTGNFFEITKQRFNDYFHITFFGNFWVFFNVLAMFLIGIYFMRKNVFQNVENNVRILKLLLFLGILVGIPASFIYAYIIHQIPKISPSFKLFFAYSAQNIGAPLTCLFYVSFITFLYYYSNFKKFLKLLAPVGRLSLTNYLLQSIICTTLFYGYGGKLFGKIGTFNGSIIAFIIFIFQVSLSNFYLKKFKFGPFEFIWRKLSYLKI